MNSESDDNFIGHTSITAAFPAVDFQPVEETFGRVTEVHSGYETMAQTENIPVSFITGMQELEAGMEMDLDDALGEDAAE